MNTATASATTLRDRLRTRAARHAALAAIPGSDDLRELPRLLRNPTGYFHERFEKHGYVWKSRLVYPVVFVIGVDANRTLMLTRRSEFLFGEGYAQTAVRSVFRNSIMLLDGEDHRRARAILVPAVDRLHVRDNARRVHEIWSARADALADGASHDAYTVAQRTTFDVAANVLTGLQLGAESEAFRPHFEALIEGIMAPTNVRVPFGRLDRAMRAREKLAELLRPKVQQARQRPADGLVGQLAHYRDDDGTPLPDDEVIEHLLLLFWAGYDTTASSATWILRVLADRPDLQDRLRTELIDAVGDDVESIEASRDLPTLTYFLMEIERMYPSALFFPRVAAHDLEYEGHHIPEGTPVFYSPYMSHRDPARYTNPDVFDLDRWSPDGPGERPKGSWLVGFGGGPRVCLGKPFARLQLKLMLHALLSRYRIEPDARYPHSVMGLPVHHPVNFHIRCATLD